MKRRYVNYWFQFLAHPSHFPAFQARAVAQGVTLLKLHRRLHRAWLIQAHKNGVIPTAN